MYCEICGTVEKVIPKVVRFWDPDDGWKAGRLCKYCYLNALECKPHPDDFAYDQKDKLFSNEEKAMSIIYG